MGGCDVSVFAAAPLLSFIKREYVFAAGCHKAPAAITDRMRMLLPRKVLAETKVRTAGFRIPDGSYFCYTIVKNWRARRDSVSLMLRQPRL